MPEVIYAWRWWPVLARRGSIVQLSGVIGADEQQLQSLNVDADAYLRPTISRRQPFDGAILLLGNSSFIRFVGIETIEVLYLNPKSAVCPSFGRKQIACFGGRAGEIERGGKCAINAPSSSCLVIFDRVVVLAVGVLVCYFRH